jgi:DNA-binding GntR family transcriptional regulator
MKMCSLPLPLQRFARRAGRAWPLKKHSFLASPRAQSDEEAVEAAVRGDAGAASSAAAEHVSSSMVSLPAQADHG